MVNSTGVKRRRHFDIDAPCVEDSAIFCIDRCGRDTQRVPMHVTTFKFAISTKVEVAELESAAPVCARREMACFNCCQTDHMLGECPFELQEERIRANRSKFRRQAGSRELPKSYRYHGLGGAGHTRRFANIRPGEFSEALRGALGLKRNQLPPFVYRMRALGYPPGWLKECEMACCVHGGGALAAHGQDGVQYDPSKLVKFPGVTAPLPDGCRDEHSRYRVKPYREGLIPLPECFSEAVAVDEVVVVIDDEEGDDVMTPEHIPVGTSLTIEQGTPIPLSAERIESRVPASQNFAVGIGEHRLFENLPGTTGNFKRLMDSVKKIRSEDAE